MSNKKTAKRRKPKKRRFKTLSLKLTIKQSRSLKNYCQARNTTPVKLIKKHIGRYLSGFENDVPEKFRVSNKQLNLFDEEG
jgi:hypothetical protein